jgi:hypothetical protein
LQREQFIGIWREPEGGVTRRRDAASTIFEATIYIDRARPRGLEVSAAKRLKALEVENATSAHAPVIESD